MSWRRIGVLRVLVATSAASGAIACNAILGIEEPPQPPVRDADTQPNGDAGADISISDGALDDATANDGTGDGVTAEASDVDADATPESGPVHDAPPDVSSDAGDAGDAFDDADPSDALDGDAGRRDASGDGGRVDGDGPRVDGDAPRIDGPRPRPDGISPPEISVVLTITKDQDDATWINGTDERLHYDVDSLYVEVGGDTEAGKAGLRFELPAPPGSIINSAIIELHRTIGDALPDESMKVQVYDSVNVLPFDDAHTHGPEAHATGGLWPTIVAPIWVGENGKAVQTAELKHLVQHVVDRADYGISGSSIGFVFSAHVMGVRWVNFADSSLGVGQPSLRLVYTPP
jgi:hypothetical protein